MTLLPPALAPLAHWHCPSPHPARPQAVKLSAFHLEVSAALAQLGVAFEVEYKTEQSLLSVDIAIITGGELRGGR